MKISKDILGVFGLVALLSALYSGADLFRLHETGLPPSTSPSVSVIVSHVTEFVALLVMAYFLLRRAFKVSQVANNEKREKKTFQPPREIKLQGNADRFSVRKASSYKVFLGMGSNLSRYLPVALIACAAFIAAMTYAIVSLDEIASERRFQKCMHTVYEQEKLKALIVKSYGEAEAKFKSGIVIPKEIKDDPNPYAELVYTHKELQRFEEEFLPTYFPGISLMSDEDILHEKNLCKIGS